MSVAETVSRYNVSKMQLEAEKWEIPRSVVYQEMRIEPLDKGHRSSFEEPLYAEFHATARAAVLDDVLVPARSIMRASSGIVGLVTVTSLVLSAISSFNLIHPLISVVLVVASTAFFLMSFAPSGGERA